MKMNITQPPSFGESAHLLKDMLVDTALHALDDHVTHKMTKTQRDHDLPAAWNLATDRSFRDDLPIFTLSRHMLRNTLHYHAVLMIENIYHTATDILTMLNLYHSMSINEIRKAYHTNPHIRKDISLLFIVRDMSHISFIPMAIHMFDLSKEDLQSLPPFSPVSTSGLTHKTPWELIIDTSQPTIYLWVCKRWNETPTTSILRDKVAISLWGYDPAIDEAEPIIETCTDHLLGGPVDLDAVFKHGLFPDDKVPENRIRHLQLALLLKSTEDEDNWDKARMICKSLLLQGLDTTEQYHVEYALKQISETRGQ